MLRLVNRLFVYPKGMIIPGRAACKAFQGKQIRSTKTGKLNCYEYIIILCASLFLSSCANSDAVSGGNRRIYSFAGNWQGSGIDSEGNEFSFAAKVIALGDHKYRVLILDKLDTQKEAMHVMDGELKGNKFAYTADEGEYVGGGELDDEMFDGYYKGPIDGTYKMHRVR